jgi:hypothetical protein
MDFLLTVPPLSGHFVAETILNVKHGVWDGLKVQYQRMTTPNMPVNHTLTYGSTDPNQPDGYVFNPTYVGTGRPDPEDPSTYPVMVSNLDTGTGMLMTTLVNKFGKNTMIVARGQSKSKAEWVGAEVTGTYTGSDYVGTVTAANCTPAKMEGTMVMSYLQKVHTNWSFGGDLLFQAAEGRMQSVMGVGGRYRDDTCSASAEVSMGKGSLQLGYFHKLDAQVRKRTQGACVLLLPSFPSVTLSCLPTKTSSPVRLAKSDNQQPHDEKLNIAEYIMLHQDFFPGVF